MSRMTAPVLLVGSIPGTDAESAMALAAAGIGDLLGCLPDGETGRRKAWINFLAAGAYDSNPALASVTRPLPVDDTAEDEWRAREDSWIPRGYADHWQFRCVEGAPIRFDTLGYAAAAQAAYPVFLQLRESGAIARHARFMVSLPLAESATRPFVGNAGDFAALHAAYQRAVQDEIAAILAVIPAAELALQWDIAIETVAIECNDELPGLFPWRPASDAFTRYQADVTAAIDSVPADVMLGLHLCYGDLGHKHIIEPPDLEVCVRMANAACKNAGRPIDFFHMPVPRARSDAAYFAPLASLMIGDAQLYLGLIHHTDGVPGALQRAAAARDFRHDFGIATECGFGRRPGATVPALLDIHREVAAKLAL